MILKALKYTRYLNETCEWSIVGKGDDYAYFGNLNLLVGKNASGKSRTLHVIREIANLLSGNLSLKKVIYPTERFELIFMADGSEYKYFLDFKDRIVVDEILKIDDKEILNRTAGLVLNKDGESRPLSVQEYDLAISMRDDNGQFYFEPMVLWGKSLKNYLFANQHEKNYLVQNYEKEAKTDKDIEDTGLLVYTFNKGRNLFGNDFIDEIKSDMRQLGYYMSNIDIESTDAGYGIYIEEEGRYVVSQREMAQGMFRALSLFIALTYARLSNLSLCILVDDMGEGLDFDRSKGLIDIVIKKIRNSNIQFIMTTNDRYIMNQIALKYWLVIDRDQTKSVFYDYTNSKEVFDDFRYTGLNNFDFLSTDFFSKGFGEVEDND